MGSNPAVVIFYKMENSATPDKENSAERQQIMRTQAECKQLLKAIVALEDEKKEHL